MKIKKLKVDLVTSLENPIKTMWIAARNCYYREGINKLLESGYNESKAIQLLKGIYERGHKSILEHSFYQFNIEGSSRSLMAQITRHRIGFSFAIQSQHYQKHEDFTFKDLEQYVSEEHKQEYLVLMDSINEFYKKSLKQGIPCYIAREVLPNATTANIILSTNLRALDHFWELRLGKENCPEIRLVAEEMFNRVIEKDKPLEQILKYPNVKL